MTSVAEKAVERIFSDLERCHFSNDEKEIITRIIQQAIDEVVRPAQNQHDACIKAAKKLRVQLADQQQVINECVEAGNIKNTAGMNFEDKGSMIINALEGYAAKQPLDEFVKTIDDQQEVIEQLVARMKLIVEHADALITSVTTIVACIEDALAAAEK